MSRPDFAKPSDETEWLDDRVIDFADYQSCLADLARVNRLTLTHRPTLAWLNGLRRRGRVTPGRTVRLVDIGYGEGDGLRAIGRWADRHGLDIELTGIDLDPRAADAAIAATPPGRPIRFLTGDLFTHDPAGFDLVVSSQMAHHLGRPTLLRFIAWMERGCRIGWMIGDLYRHSAAQMMFGPLASLAGWHRFVRHDGPISIRRSMVPAEWHAVLAEAGLSGEAGVRAWLPFRIAVTRERPA